MCALELTRVDYTVVGVTNTNCLQLIPSNVAKEPQKVVIADVDGVVQVFSLKKQQIQLHFRTLPGPPIYSVKLGAATGNVFDKIFVASGNEVRGYTKKGKLFLSFDSGMTEEICTMFVLENELFLCGKHTYTHYRDLKENGSYLCGDKIVDVLAFYLQKSHRLITLIACEGRMIRALEHARVTMSMEIESTPTILHIYEDDDNKTIIFGTTDGRIGVLDVDNLQGFQRWLLSNESNSSSICSIDSYDLNGIGTKQLIIGRQDGNIEVHQVNINEDSENSRLIFSYNCSESISSLKCGVISPGYDEIVVATYTGRIFGLTTKNIDGDLDNSAASYIASADASQKIFNLKADIEELKGKVLKERERYHLSTQSTFDDVSAIPLLLVKDSFILDKKTSNFMLSIEVPTAIDNILLQSNTEVNLLDVEKNSAIISYSDLNKQENNFLLATYRCQMNTNRLEMKIQTKEGKYAILQAYVTPIVQPKCSRLLRYEIKALSLHQRLYQFDDNRPLNKLTLKGSFSLAEIHAWVGQCLPEVPDKPHQDSEKTVLWFGSTLLDSILECSYQKGEAEFRSDNISTISILKEILTLEATKKKIKLDINTFINNEAINFILKSVEEKLSLYQRVSKEICLLNALDELEVTEEETTKYLSRKYKNIMNNGRDIKKQAENDPNRLKKIYSTIIDLYTAYAKLKGFNPKQKEPNLREALENYDSGRIISIFGLEKNTPID